MKPDNSQTYGTVSRLLHWLMALCFVVMFGTALAWNINEDYFSLMGIHKNCGIALLVLALVRFVWMHVNLRRRPQHNIIVKIGHIALYLLMIAVPAVGLIRNIGKGAPDGSGEVEWMVQLGNQWHGELAIALGVLILGHIAMAVVHQIKGEKIINRMLG